jgi:hypothetical protein
MTKKGSSSGTLFSLQILTDFSHFFTFSDCAKKQLSGQALDDGVAKKLWEMSEQMVGLYNEVK